MAKEFPTRQRSSINADSTICTRRNTTRPSPVSAKPCKLTRSTGTPSTISVRPSTPLARTRKRWRSSTRPSKSRREMPPRMPIRDWPSITKENTSRQRPRIARLSNNHQDFSEAQNGLGASLLHLGKNEEAIASFRSSVASNPRNAEALENLGSALRGENKATEALPFLRKAHAPELAGGARNLRFGTGSSWTDERGNRGLPQTDQQVSRSAHGLGAPGVSLLQI